LSQGYHQLGEARKQAVAAPGDILLDLARAYSDMGRFEEAAQLYGRLAEGLDTRRDPAAYWAAELGYCRSILAARRQDKRAMKSLVVRIAQLKQQDPSLGNLAGQFEDIEAQAA
jgi:tetratricopeptide (TPR) repeat protein